MPKFKAGDHIERNDDGIKATVNGISRGVSRDSDKYFLEVKQGGSYTSSKTWNVDLVDAFWNLEKTSAIQANSISTGKILSGWELLIGEASIISDKPKTVSYELLGTITDELETSVFQLRRVTGTLRNLNTPDTMIVNTDLSDAVPVRDGDFLRALKLLVPGVRIIRKVVV